MDPKTADATQHEINFLMQMQYECLPYEVILWVKDNESEIDRVQCEEVA